MGADNRGDLRLLAVVLVSAIALVAVLGAFLLPLGGDVKAAFDAGLGIEEAVVWGFATTIAVLILFALVAGDGLLGEIQFMLGSFFAFFAVFTLLIGWVF